MRRLQVIPEMPAMRSLTFRKWFVLVVALSVWVGCQRSSQQTIIGKWKEVNGTHTLQFFPDGTVVFYDGNKSYTRSYSFPDPSHLRIDEAGEAIVVDVAVSQTRLSMTYHRAPSDKATVLERIQ